MSTVAADDGAELFVRVDGPATAPPILFLHSIGCDHRLWDAQAGALNAYRVIRPDLRGHGRSAAPPGDYPLDRLVADAVAVLDAACATPAVVCGLSLGGLVAQALALAAPHRVAGLVLASTAPRIGAPEAWRDRAAAVRAGGLGAISDMVMARFFSDPFRDARPDVVAAYRSRLEASSPQGYAGCCAALRDADLTARLGEIAAPCLVVAGLADVSTPPDQVRGVAHAIRGAAYRELDAGHLSNVEQPQAFSDLLRAFLEDL